MAGSSIWHRGGGNGGTATGAHYAASKGGIMTVTKVFARELAGAGVRSMPSAPGPLDLASLRDKISDDKIAVIEEDDPGRPYRRPCLRRCDSPASRQPGRVVGHRRDLGHEWRIVDALSAPRTHFPSQ